MSSNEPESRDEFSELPPPRPTTPPVRRGFLWVLVLLMILTAGVYGVPYMLDKIGYAYETGRARAASEALARLDKAGALARASELFRLATHAVSPAVVHIRTQSFEKNGGMGLGSGVVIDKEKGLIVTNQHVIRDADLIVVRVGRSEMNAELVGQDPKTDLAVVRVKGSLPMAAEWADSDRIEAGDWVLAIGSPYGLERTVSAGIVSATARNNLGVVAADAYEDFIQTDVAINPGNSGGPLVDLQGHVVGINTAVSVVSPDQGNQGIGFAISSALARRVVDQLVKSGKVIRGYLGVVAQPVSPDRGKQLNLPDGKGVAIGLLLPSSPADRAGLKVGDVITAIDGKPVTDPSGLRNRTFTLEAGSVVPITYFRSGVEQTAQVSIAEMPQDPVLAYYGFSVKDAPGGEDEGGVEVAEVVPGTPASAVGLVPGLRILSIGPRRFASKAEFDNLILPLVNAPEIPLGVLRDGGIEVLKLATPGGEQP
ncbi:trypsin-like peptidase domain-containing protein [Tundrisphaera lichenicola]|uniref:trypsin-like peptidase domain-containing protein n=1 Tax=Tundrisphaera lichenicola TaxID=2029860 RepID=UPI003EB80F06